MILVLSTKARTLDVTPLVERLGESLLLVNGKGELIRVVSDGRSAAGIDDVGSGVVPEDEADDGTALIEDRGLRAWLERRVGQRSSLARLRARESPVRSAAERLRADQRGAKDDDRVRNLVEVVDHWSPQVAIVADEAAERIGLQLSRARPQMLVLSGLATSMACLEELAASGREPTLTELRNLLDPDGTQRPVAHDPGAEIAPSPTRVVSLVANAIEGDSRVQKVAASLASFGFDSVLLGWHLDPPETWLVGGATVRVLWGKRYNYEWERESPPRAWSLLLAYRSRNEMLAAQSRARARSREASARAAAGQQPDRWPGSYVRQWDAARRWWVASRANSHQVNRRQFFALTYGEPGRPTGPRALSKRLPRGLRHHEFALRWDLEDTFGPELERLRPRVIHAHDAEMLPVAVHAARRLRSSGHLVQVVYDAHEYIPGTARSHSQQRAVLSEIERMYAPQCEAVVTVSDEIASLLSSELHLQSYPVVVENAPDVRRRAEIGDVRAALGLPISSPLMVYVGGVAPQRGVDLAVEALTHLPDVHLALIAPESSQTRALEKQAKAASTHTRLHRLDYVPADAVVDFLRTADIGLIPFRALRNSELGIPTKFREYVHAGLPVVCSDAGLSARAVRSTGIGEVFKVGDSSDLAKSVATVLAKASDYRARIDAGFLQEHSWERQERRLFELYRRLSGNASLRSGGPRERKGVLLGPRNVAGQSAAWAKALRSQNFDALSYQILKPEHPFRFDSDVTLTTERMQKADIEMATLARFIGQRSHVLLDIGSQALWPVDPERRGLRQLKRSGIHVGLVGHGSEIRRPLRHAEREKWSPYRDPANADFREDRRRATAAIHAELSGFDGPTFVTTPDLLDDVPWATWLPVVVDTAAFAPPAEPTGRNGRPVVLHVPSRGFLKGSQYVDPILQQLHVEGVIRYLRAEGVAHARMPALIRSVDIVVDQVLMNLMGVGAAEAMASGRVVVAHVDEQLASRYPMPPPVVDATPDTLEQVVRELAADGDRRATLGRLGREFAETVHDGRLAAQVLIEGLGLDVPDPLR